MGTSSSSSSPIKGREGKGRGRGRGRGREGKIGEIPFPKNYFNLSLFQL